MTTLIIDTAEAQKIVSSLPAIKASGIKTIFGYMSSINPNGAKCLTIEQVKAIGAAGLRVGLVHEGYGGVGGKGISDDDGVRDGAFCRAKASLLGAPKGACVYFACDQDFTSAQISARVLPYFRAITKQFGDRFYRVGVYGSGEVCQVVTDYGLADLTWLAQSRGWMSYSAWLAKASDVQGPSTKLDGLSVDTDVAHSDIGDFVPFQPIVIPIPKEPSPIVASNEGWFSKFLKRLHYG